MASSPPPPHRRDDSGNPLPMPWGGHIGGTSGGNNNGDGSSMPWGNGLPGGGGGGPGQHRREDALQLLHQTLRDWGLGDLFKYAMHFITQGFTQEEIQLKLQQTDEYKQRFIGNEYRQKAGLGTLSPGQYIALEGQYRQILSQLPRGFYDSHDALAKFIGGDVSASELASRVQLANDAWVSAPQTSRDAWNKYFGHHGAGGAVAAILDTKTAEPLLQQQVTAAGIGGDALAQGLKLTDPKLAMQAAQQGVTIDQARQAYQGIASRLGVDHAASARFGGVFDQHNEEQANLLGNADQQQRQRTLYAEESSLFSGVGGASATAGDPGANF